MITWEFPFVPMAVQTFALQVAIGGAVFSGLVLLVARLLCRSSAPVRYGVLLAGVFGLLALPALIGVGVNAPSRFLPADVEIVRFSAETLPVFLNEQPAGRPAADEVPSVVGDIIGTLLLIVWGGIAILALMRLLFGLYKQRRAIAGQPWSAVWWTEERAACLAEKVGLRRFPAVYSSPIAPMPMVVGLLRPKIILPEQAPGSWGQPQWEAVLLHEAAHIARRDPWAAFAQCLAVILFWWCRLVHLMARQLNDLREAICDDYALEGPCDRLAYAELLVEAAERLVNLRTLPLSVGLLDSARGGLEARITRLLEKENEPMKKLSLAGKLFGASLLVAACLSITAVTALSQAPPAKKIQIKIVMDGKEFNVGDVDLSAFLQAAQPRPKAEAAPKDAKQSVDMAVLKFFLEGKDAHVFQIGSAGPGAKPDPRIEELVKQAEAIKPGSGAAIRSALEAAPNDRRPLVAELVDIAGTIKPAPAKSATIRLQMEPNKHVIVLTVEPTTGKVTQLQGAELKKFLDKGTRGAGMEMRWEVAPGESNAKDPKKTAAEWQFKALQGEKTMKLAPASPAKPADPTAPRLPGLPGVGATPAWQQDVDALARQLERITAELRELRQRLDANKR